MLLLPGEPVCGAEGVLAPVFLLSSPSPPRTNAAKHEGWAVLVLAPAKAMKNCPVARGLLQGLETESKGLRKQKAQALDRRGTTSPWLQQRESLGLWSLL